MQDSGSGSPAPRRRSRWERAAESLASSRPGGWWYVNVAPIIDRRLIPLTGGRLTTGGFGRVGLLRVRGARTGALRETPLVYTREDERVLVVASRGGDVKHPAWYRNVVANPEVSFEIEGDERPYLARTLAGGERERAWFAVCERYAGYAAYQRRAGSREIPVVALEPRRG